MSANKDRPLIDILINAQLLQEYDKRRMGVVQRERIALPSQQPGGEGVRIFVSEKYAGMCSPNLKQ